MSWPRWKKVGVILAGVAATLAVVVLGAQSFPRPLALAADVGRVAGADIAASDRSITPFRAEYSRWDAVLGVPIQWSSGVVTAEHTAPGTVDVTFELSDFGTDRMRLDATSLVLQERSFGAPEGPGQSFRREGDTIHATVRAADGSTRDLAFRYPVAVFEPSLLELPLALLDLRLDDEGHLAWSNFADESAYWAPYRVLSQESISAAGRTFDTHRVRVEFPGGRQRDYWIAAEPPYKIRMVSYNRGRLTTNGWELLSFEVHD